ncbi:MAG TPA: hypothetical protein EYP59_06985 [Thiotrichaceae bacterium]|nr:hypothetical protein [Thiotrichaceae bacterium]
MNSYLKQPALAPPNANLHQPHWRLRIADWFMPDIAKSTVFSTFLAMCCLVLMGIPLQAYADNDPYFRPEPSLASSVQIPETIRFSGEACDDIGLKRISMHVNGPEFEDWVFADDLTGAPDCKDLSSYYFDSDEFYSGVPGNYDVYLYIKDVSDNFIYREFRVKVIKPIDKLGPTLRITTSNGQHVSSSSIRVKGTATDSGRGDNGVKKVSVNGSYAKNDDASGNRTENCYKNVNLNVDRNTIEVVAYDNDNNSTSQQITIYRDEEDDRGPSLKITSHSNGQSVSSSSITLRGTATDSGRGGNSVKKVLVNGSNASNGSASDSRTADWYKTVSLNVGNNRIEVKAYDNKNNRTTEVITINRKTIQAAQKTLTIKKSGNGRVTSSPSGIDCGNSCSSDNARYDQGKSVKLTASAYSGSEFDYWSNCPSPSGNVCQITLSSDRTVTANFKKKSAPTDKERPTISITSPTNTTTDRSTLNFAGNNE